MPLSSQHGIQILHVDDEPAFADLTETFLEREDDRFTVETATSADEGLQRISDRPPDCVVSDYNMPGMDGIEFLQAVREEYPALPFILFTGKGSEVVASEAIAADVTDYLQKGSGSEKYELLANRIRNAVKQHRSEKRLRETRREYTAVFENVQNGLLLVDVEDDGFRYQQCNPRAVELIGRDKTEIVGKSPYEALGPENGKKVVEAYRRCTEQGNSVEYTVTLDLPIGQVVRKCEATPVAANGEVGQLVVAFQDITERKERQRELRRNKRAMDEAPVGITLSDPSQDDNPLIYVNDRFEEVTGYDEDESVGRNCRFLQGDDTRAEPVAQMREAIHARDPVTVELRNYRRDGSEFWNRVSIAPVYDDQGSVINFVGFQQDITERKERQRERRRSERRLNALLEHSTDRINVTDAEGRYTFVSPSVEPLFGHDPAELVGESAFEYIHPEDRAETRATFEQILSDPDGIYSVEYRYRDDDGSWRWVESRGTNRLDDPAIEGVVINSREITDRKQREQELARTRDLITNMEELADVGAWEYDAETEQLTITDGTRRLYGLDPDADLTLEAALDAVHPDDRDRLADRLNTCLETGEPYEVEVRLTTVDGGQRWIIARGERVERHESGTVIRGYIQDITEERRQRLQLEETAARLEALFDRSPDMIDIHDSDGNILDVNQQLAERTGYAKHELTELKVWDLDVRITPAEARSLWRDMDPDGRRQLEGVYECRDGSTFPVEVHIRRLDIEDDDLFVVISRDITEQTERERELYTQNERLDELASIVSHDLRSPLTVAAGNLELAQETRESEHLTKAADAIDRSQALIDDLLTLAREGEQVTEVESVVLADVAETSWQTTETRSATLDTDTTQAVRADRSRLQQLLANLYRNAVEHGGDDVTVSVGGMDDGFYVADTGPGIPESDRDEVFEARYSTTEDGTGFGLRIVEQIADAHGWEIAVTESEQGGARFEITGVEFADR